MDNLLKNNTLDVLKCVMQMLSIIKIFMKRKVILTLLSFFVISLLIQCWGGKELISYKIIDFEISNKSIDSSYNISSDINNSNNILDSSYYYGMLLDFETQETGREKISQMIKDFSIINKAQAFAKTITAYKLINPIDNIKINTVNDFDSLHGANTCINDYFIFSDFYRYHHQSVSDSLSSSLKSYEEPFSFIPRFTFLLLEKPKIDSILELKVDMYFRDLTVISKNTIPIIIE